MHIGIIDAELLFKSAYSELGKHRFPNLASMKISGYHKARGDTVTLITKMPSDVQCFYKLYDKIYISKVFVETCVPTELLNLSNVIYGGTGFYYANAPELLESVEHSMPDYTLYNDWIKERKELKSATDEFTYYEDYSLGFSVRGCVRGCKFCINQHCNKVVKASPVKEFLNTDRPKICLLDDNVLAYENWREIFDELNATGKWFEFKQGLDIRAMTKEKAEVIAKSNININTIYFAFDNIKDKDIIEEKLDLWRQHYRKNTHMYVLCGFDENNKYDEEFWAKDMENTLERIRICIKYGVFPYVMRHRMYNTAPTLYRGMYINLSAWCNQKSLFSKWSFNEWADNIQKANEKQLKKKRLYSSKRYLMEYAGKFPDIAYEYFNLKYTKHNEYTYKKGIDSNKKLTALLSRVSTDKIKSKKVMKILEEDLLTQNNITEVDQTKTSELSNNILDYFKYPIQTFNNGMIMKFNARGVKSIPNNSMSLILINCKNEILDECDKILLNTSEKYLKTDGNLYVYNIDLKSFTFTKDFIENHTKLKFKEVASFSNYEKTKTQYCSRYVLKDESNIFDTNNFDSRTLLLKNMIKKSTKENDSILVFFESHSFFEKIGEEYFKRNWVCFKKRMLRDTNTALKFLNKELKTKKTSLLDTQNLNIG